MLQLFQPKLEFSKYKSRSWIGFGEGKSFRGENFRRGRETDTYIASDRANGCLPRLVYVAFLPVVLDWRACCKRVSCFGSSRPRTRSSFATSNYYATGLSLSAGYRVAALGPRTEPRDFLYPCFAPAYRRLFFVGSRTVARTVFPQRALARAGNRRTWPRLQLRSKLGS